MKRVALVVGLMTGCSGATNPGSSGSSTGAGGDSGALADDGSLGSVPTPGDASSDRSPGDGGEGTGQDAGSGGDDAASPLDGSARSDAAVGDGHGVFVAVGYGGRRMRSVDDGMTWTDDQSIESSGGDDNDLLRTVAFGDGQFIAAGWLTFSSPDGKTWSPLPATHQNWFGALTFADRAWVAVGGYGMRLTSADATTWTDHSIDTTAAHPHGCLTFAEAPAPAFVACNDSGARSYSPDGVTWTYSTGATSVVSSQVAAGAGVVVGADGTSVVVSKDVGKTWTPAKTLDTAGGGLVFAQGHFTYLSTDAVYTSTDGTQWTKNMATGARPSALAYGHGTYVAVRAHAWQRSADGLAWSSATQDAEKDNAFEWVTFGATP